MESLPGRVQQRRQPALGLQLRPAEAGERIVVLAFLLGDFPGEIELASCEDGGLRLRRGRIAVPAGERLEHRFLPLLRGLGQLVVGQEIHHPGRRVRIRAALEQGPDRIHAVARRREDERGLAPGGFPGVHLGAMIDQRRDGVDAARVGREVQGGRSARAGHARWIGTGRQQQLHRLGLPGGARHVQRGVAADAGRRLHGGAALEERFDERGVAALGGPVERRHAVSVGGVGILAGGEQGPDRVEVTDPRGIGHRRRRGRRRDRQTGDQEHREGGAQTTGSPHWPSPLPGWDRTPSPCP